MDMSDEGLESFAEGPNKFPRRLQDDCVEYSVFILDLKLKSQKQLLAQLEVVRRRSSKLTDSLLKDYIWQRENFKLEIESDEGLTYLHGLTNYGDSVEDEWLIVYILKELSKEFPELWIKIVDTDGEFLLIEAANALPRWLNPEIADNRVWIHHNQLRIIPLTASPISETKEQIAPISRSLTLQEAREIVSSTPSILINSPLIEEEAFYRLRNYPEQIQASIHHSIITIPRKLAFILHDHPAYISSATEAFYLRDSIALKPFRAGSSDLIFAPQDLVTVSTRFTKVLYSQLKSQQFEPPISWRDMMAKAAENSGESGDIYAKLEMGMKVTSGFEMLVTDANNRDSRVARELEILLNDLADEDASYLPSDQMISQWQDVTREDSESWLDINFEDFEKELQGKSGTKPKNGMPGAFSPDPPSGFGDSKTQADLEKMVERFESFLNDDKAGIDGAEMDDMDFDNDDEEEEEDSEDEDKDVSFDEREFAKMMREMMGMPPEEDETQGGVTGVTELDDSEYEGDLDEASKIMRVMAKMEAELNEAGALNLDPIPRNSSGLDGKHKKASEIIEDDDESGEDGAEHVDIDYDLAKNLLESFKSQHGMAGPGGNLLAALGLHLPRDEEDTSSPGPHN